MTRTHDLTLMLADTGLLQFGWFDDGRPFQTGFEMLASYPHVLEQAAAEANDALAPLGADRLLCAGDALPLGVALSLVSRVPLVYSRGADEAAVFDLAGAYDIGHATVLVANVWDQDERLRRIADRARHVGLETRALLTLLDIGAAPPPMPLTALLRLDDAADVLVSTGRLPTGQANAVREWMSQQ